MCSATLHSFLLSHLGKFYRTTSLSIKKVDLFVLSSYISLDFVVYSVIKI